jgi:protein-S-isoprenylcysteine O-methyltransferase Ste14
MPVEIKLILFAVFSGLLGFISRRALRSRGAHGFYRFFAWEAILALVLLNLEHWFADPFSPAQCISWACLLASLGLLGGGLHLLRRLGRPSETSRADETLLGLEKTTVLVTHGLYRWIRHPLYSSLLFLAWGVFFKQLSWPGLALALAASAFLAATAKVEEKENLRYFGHAYADYMQHTRMFIPFLF